MKKIALVLLGAGLTAAMACVAVVTAQAQKMPEVDIILNWFAEPPHGGYYAAVQDGLYEARGVKVRLIPGGPNVAGYQLVATGRAAFAQMDTGGILQSREEGLPVVGVFADLQLSPQVLMFHKDNPIKGFADLAGRQVAVTPGAPYWDYIVAKYKLQGKAQQINYSGQVATFLANKKLVSQGYAVAEPYTIKEAGGDIDYLLVSDSGFSPYGVLGTTEEFIQKNRKVVQAVVAASQEGWNRYIANPAKYADALKGDNRDLNPAFLAWSGKAVIPFAVGKDGQVKKNGFGTMQLSRWTEVHKALRAVGLLKKDQDVTKAFTTAFIPKP
jgi:NitT/TauT family transport system substrate-binding protein